MRRFVGSGTGPEMRASVALAASMILSQALCMWFVSNERRRMRIFCACTAACARATPGEGQSRSSCHRAALGRPVSPPSRARERSGRIDRNPLRRIHRVRALARPHVARERSRRPRRPRSRVRVTRSSIPTHRLRRRRLRSNLRAAKRPTKIRQSLPPSTRSHRAVIAREVPPDALVTSRRVFAMPRRRVSRGRRTHVGARLRRRGAERGDGLRRGEHAARSSRSVARRARASIPRADVRREGGHTTGHDSLRRVTSQKQRDSRPARRRLDARARAARARATTTASMDARIDGATTRARVTAARASDAR